MKEQTPLSADELQEAFAKARADFREALGKEGTGAILKHLSNAVSRLQDAGADISIEVRYGGSNNAYDMVYTAASAARASAPAPGNAHVSYGSVEAHGYIRTGGATRLFAIATKIADTPVEQLYLSNYNVKEEGGRMKIAKIDSRTQAVIPADIYDFGEDAEALAKFEKTLADISASNSVLLENDPAGVFNKPATAHTKPTRKLGA